MPFCKHERTLYLKPYMGIINQLVYSFSAKRWKEMSDVYEFRVEDVFSDVLRMSETYYSDRHVATGETMGDIASCKGKQPSLNVQS